MELIVLTLIIGATILLAFYIGRIFKSQEGKDTVDVAEEVPEEVVKEVVKEEKSKAKKVDKKGRGEKQPTFQHPWLLTSLKGHSGRVLDLDISPNGKYLASCGEDRTVLVWSTKDFPSKEHKCFRCNVEYDHGLFVKWSPDSKAFVVQKAVQNCTEVYKMGKKPDGAMGEFSVAVTFPSKHETDIIGLGIAANGKFIATCTDKTDLIVWSLKGDVLDRINTNHNLTYCCKVSPCGRFVATSGFTPDVKVWEVKFSRSGDFEKVNRAFDLTGHRSGVYSFAFSADSGRMATVSKDGTWKVYDTNIEYVKGQDPEVLITGNYSGDCNKSSTVALSPDGRVVAIAQDKNLSLYSVSTGECSGTIADMHTETITSLLFDSGSNFIITSGDKHVRVFHNVPGKMIQIQDLKEALKRNISNSAAKERIEMQIKEAEESIQQIVG
jgi:WD40 repeat protein